MKRATAPKLKEAEPLARPPHVLIPPGGENYAADYLASKVLRGGRVAWVIPMTFGKGRIIVQCDVFAACYEDCWCYDDREKAISALDAWNGEGEPAGWIRHPASGRRRPDGDASQEYVNP